MRIKLLLAPIAVAAALVACGGSNDNSGSGGGSGFVPPTTAVPASASTSVDGFITYLQQLVVSFADLLEPVDTSAVTGPTDETSEPTKID